MIIDTFPFNKDFNALEIRLEELKEVVDIFIASESAFTHSGIRKELHLANARALRAKMGDKLVVLSNSKRYLTNNSRTREMLQRQEITKYLRKMNPKPYSMIIHSDCDEIPRSEVVFNLYSRNTPVNAIFELDNYANYLNTLAGKWLRGRAISWSLFRSIQHIRADIYIYTAAKDRRHKFPFMRLTDFWSAKRFPFNKLPERITQQPLEVIQSAGWHFNNLFGESEIIEKIQSSSHVEWNTPIARDQAISHFRNASDIYTGEKHKISKIDSSYPKSIRENLERWQHYIYKTGIDA
jgi:beta-1,4-mannosyl-glycoprotein beta-1,4-N-acetylglucosaminyltransferase